MSTRHAVVDTVIGGLTVVAADDVVVGIYFPGHWTLRAGDRDGFGPRVEAAGDPVLAVAEDQLRAYLAGERAAFDLPVRLVGNDFQQRVWALLREIPAGATTTYGALAERLGGKALAQSVGQAVGHNPVSIVVPCHRVVGHDGRLTGYAGGLERKRFLLDLETPAAKKVPTLF